MQHLLAIFALILSLSPLPAEANFKCDEEAYTDPNIKDLPVGDKRLLITEGPLIEGGVIACGYASDIYKPTTKHAYAIEKGNIDGVLYSIFYDVAVGSVQGKSDSQNMYMFTSSESNWVLRCNIDELFDKVSCVMEKDTLRLTLNHNKVMHVNVEDYPREGSKVFVRIDKGTVYESMHKDGFDASTSATIISEMTKGKLVQTRHIDRKNEWPVDTKISLFAVNEALTVMRKVHETLATLVNKASYH